MWKHCKFCNMDIDDSMGIWDCPLCGRGLIKGYYGTGRGIVVGL